MQGICLCGDVVWEVEGPGELVHHCHCGMCRKVHGTPYATAGGFPEASFRFVRGKEGLRHYESSRGNRRGFCGRCGSTLTYQGDRWPGEVHLHVGAFDDPGTLAPTGHAFADERVSWLKL